MFDFIRENQRKYYLGKRDYIQQKQSEYSMENKIQIRKMHLDF